MGRNTRNRKDTRTAKSFNTSFRGNSSFSSNRPMSTGPREMHPAKCGECGADCEVPFKPTEGKPVYCRDCYKKKKAW